MNYKTENNVIYVNRLKLEDLLSLLATIHHITNGKGFLICPRFNGQLSG